MVLLPIFKQSWGIQGDAVLVLNKSWLMLYLVPSLCFPLKS